MINKQEISYTIYDLKPISVGKHYKKLEKSDKLPKNIVNRIKKLQINANVPLMKYNFGYFVYPKFQFSNDWYDAISDSVLRAIKRLKQDNFKKSIVHMFIQNMLVKYGGWSREHYTILAKRYMKVYGDENLEYFIDILDNYIEKRILPCNKYLLKALKCEYAIEYMKTAYFIYYYNDNRYINSALLYGFSNVPNEDNYTRFIYFINRKNIKFMRLNNNQKFIDYEKINKKGMKVW